MILDVIVKFVFKYKCTIITYLLRYFALYEYFYREQCSKLPRVLLELLVILVKPARVLGHLLALSVHLTLAGFEFPDKGLSWSEIKPCEGVCDGVSEVEGQL